MNRIYRIRLGPGPSSFCSFGILSILFILSKPVSPCSPASAREIFARLRDSDLLAAQKKNGFAYAGEWCF